MKRVPGAVVVLGAGLLVGCAHASGTAESPRGAARAAGPAAVLTLECERGRPHDGEATSTVATLRTLLDARRVTLVAPPEASDRSLLCSAYGRAAHGLSAEDVASADWSVGTDAAALVRATARRADARAVLLVVAVYERDCAEARREAASPGVRCGPVAAASLRAYLFAADGTLAWKTWGEAKDTPAAVRAELAPMLARVPASRFVDVREGVQPPAPEAPLARDDVGPSPPPPDARAPESDAVPAVRTKTQAKKLRAERASPPKKAAGRR